METNLPLHCRLCERMRQLLPWMRITQVRMLALVVVALQQSRSIHLSQIANVLPGSRARIPSLVNRLHRFLSNRRIVPAAVYRPFVAELLAPYAAGGAIRLVMDVSQAGRHCRLLSVSLACRRRTLLVAWSVHAGVKGGVAVAAQLALLEHLHALLPAGATVSLLADAGFEAGELVRWLVAHGWHFTLRRPGDHKVCSHPDGAASADAPLPAWVRLEAIALRRGQSRFLGPVDWTEKHAIGPVYLTLHWAKGEEKPWYLISSEPTAGAAVRHYRQRMWVEEMYGDFKRHGFHLEMSHLRHPDRIERLLLALCLCYQWCIALAAWVVKNGRRRLVDHKSRRDKSYFRLGLDWLYYCRRLAIPIPIRFLPDPVNVICS